MKQLLSRIVKSDVLKQEKDPMKVDLSNSGNMLDHLEVNVGFSADKSLKELVSSKVHNVSERAIMQFRMECRSFVQAVVSKLQEKSLTYTISRKLSCLDLKTVATESCEQNVAAFRVFARLLHEANRVDERDADAVISQYKKFLDDVVSTHKSVS